MDIWEGSEVAEEEEMPPGKMQTQTTNKLCFIVEQQLLIHIPFSCKINTLIEIIPTRSVYLIY